MPHIDPDNPRQPYEQIADFYRDEIRSGRLPIGARLPSGRSIAADFHVAHGTATKALDVLRAEGLIATWQGRGGFVRARTGDDVSTNDATGQPYDRIMSRLQKLHNEIRDLAQRVAALEDNRSSRPKRPAVGSGPQPHR